MTSISYEKNLLLTLGFTAKENSNGIFYKKYADNYTIEIDFINEKLNYGNLIQAESKTTQNFSQKENWVVLECVDRLMEKGYAPHYITLEKVFPSGHGTSGRLDILVSRDDGSAYMMIECKTWGTEFEKEFKNLNKDGGQLFTYFQQDNNTDILILYASRFNEHQKCVDYTNQIIKIEEEYRAAGNVKDFYDRWNKLPKNNGIFEDFAKPFEFISKALTKKDLKALGQADSSFIFNRFLEILRHNIVSDKPNAFNKIFTLFLCKIIDEDRNADEQLHFQWLEGEDTAISFQKRLADLYTRGMRELLEKHVVDVSDSEFDKQFQQVDDEYRAKFKDMLTEIRLKKNNEFAIKEVYDDDSFNENAIVVKEVVELLQTYQIRYNYRQQFLSDFFELLLTTGLKQESGQFFTPVPVARFIIRSIPFVDITKAKIDKADKTDLLPVIIDYSAGSGHFITESMEEIQNYIDTIDEAKLSPNVARAIAKWKVDQFDWAEDYVYAIEKDYRLVKTAKVSCYLHGDGLAKVIHGDGLADFATAKEYKDKLKRFDKTYPQDNKEFDIIVSNPPYSVSAFKGMMDSIKSANNFELYGRLTDQSSEIEALFIERTKQLLKDGGVAGIILPSSILSNGGIYSDAREIILKYFDIVAITELGSNTFMATGTNTVVLFLRRRNNADHRNIKESIAKLFENKNDITINGIETPLSKYLAHVYEGMNKEEYFASFENSTEEQEKLLYFIISYPQKVVIVKTGSKNDEKKFLGYEFSARRGSEGIHPIQRDKSIDDCTMLYDPNSYDNEQRASSYIYSAYKGDFKAIDESLKDNLSYACLVDMLDFEQVEFKNAISLNTKKKVVLESKYPLEKIENIILKMINGSTPSKKENKYWNSQDVYWLTIPDFNNENIYITTTSQYVSNNSLNDKKVSMIPIDSVVITCTATIGKVGVTKIELTANQQINALVCDISKIIPEFLTYFLKTQKENLENLTSNSGVKHINQTMLKNFKIPLPPLDIQQQIVKECEKVDDDVTKANKIIVQMRIEVENKINHIAGEMVKLGEIGKASMCKRIFKEQTSASGDVPFYKIGTFGKRPDAFIKQELFDEYKSKFSYPKKGDILISTSGTIGKTVVFDGESAYFQDSNIVWIDNDERRALNGYLNVIFQNINWNPAMGTTIARLYNKIIEETKIPLPSFDIQKKIVAEIETLEAKIAEAKSVIESSHAKKEAILKNYL